VQPHPQRLHFLLLLRRLFLTPTTFNFHRYQILMLMLMLCQLNARLLPVLRALLRCVMMVPLMLFLRLDRCFAQPHLPEAVVYLPPRHLLHLPRLQQGPRPLLLLS